METAPVVMAASISVFSALKYRFRNCDPEGVFSGLAAFDIKLESRQYVVPWDGISYSDNIYFV